MSGELFQFSTVGMLAILATFFVVMVGVSLLITRRSEDADAYVVSTRRVGFGLASASMTATWIWAASFFGAAISGYTYGVSGPLHYGLWGALMILFIYPFGQRIRRLAPRAHTLGEVIHARHGTLSQTMLALSNFLGSGISLMVNLTAAGALASVLSPLTFTQGVIIAAVTVLCYTLWPGFRASVITDVFQAAAMFVIAIIIIPVIFFRLGGPTALAEGLRTLTDQQRNLFSSEAFLEQGGPFFVAILAYAIGNQTIMQRLFAVREDRIKHTFLAATLGYGSIVIGLGMLGMMALMVGIAPVGGDVNNIVPQMASQFLPAVLLVAFVFLVIASLSSTADSDLAALSSIVMTDFYRRHVAARRGASDRTMLIVGRVTMVLAAVAGVLLATLRVNILDALVFVATLWGAIVFPVIFSIYSPRVTNVAFSSAVLSGLVVAVAARFEWIPIEAPLSYVLEAVAAVGGGVVLGIMTFAFLGERVGVVVGVLAGLVLIPLCVGFLADYIVLLSSLLAFGASAIVCTIITFAKPGSYDFSEINRRVRDFTEAPAQDLTPGPPSNGRPVESLSRSDH